MDGDIGGELADLLRQVGWQMGDEFKADLRRAIERYGLDRWSEGFREKETS